MTIPSRLFAVTLALAMAGCAPVVQAPPPPAAAAPAYPMVGGATMYPTYTLFQNVQASADHKVLAAAVQAAGLAAPLSGVGPYTLFAPTDAAFAQLPNGIVPALMHPRSRSELTGLISYHIVSGTKTRAQIAADIRAGGGGAVYRTLQGQNLRVTIEGGAIVVADLNGRRSKVSIADIPQANGVLHVVDTVLLPAA